MFKFLFGKHMYDVILEFFLHCTKSEVFHYGFLQKMWLHLLKKSALKKFIFFAVLVANKTSIFTVSQTSFWKHLGITINSGVTFQEYLK